jgi:ligand-binding sensor domain-containing protein
MIEDKKGNFWVGGSGGLYRINPNGVIINVTKNGPTIRTEPTALLRSTQVP